MIFSVWFASGPTWTALVSGKWDASWRSMEVSGQQQETTTRGPKSHRGLPMRQGISKFPRPAGVDMTSLPSRTNPYLLAREPAAAVRRDTLNLLELRPHLQLHDITAL